jgi:hypothetical protein
MRRTNGNASIGAVITSSWPSAKFTPVRTATSANRSSLSASIVIGGSFEGFPKPTLIWGGVNKPLNKIKRRTNVRFTFA